MEDEIFSLVAAKIKEAGTTDPVEVARHFDIMVVNLKGSIIGYAALYNGIVPAIGINTALEGKWLKLVGWHELAHVFDRHIYESGFKNGHADFSSFGQDIDSRTISRHEKVANLVAADVCIPDGDVIEITGYNNPSMQSYRRMKVYLEKLTREFETFRCSIDFSHPTPYVQAKAHEMQRKIREGIETLYEMESDLVYSNCCKTFSEMAAELDISESILRYKLEALNMKGMDIDRQELERYDRIFDGAI